MATRGAHTIKQQCPLHIPTKGGEWCKNNNDEKPCMSKNIVKHNRKTHAHRPSGPVFDPTNNPHHYCSDSTPVLKRKIDRDTALMKDKQLGRQIEQTSSDHTHTHTHTQQIFAERIRNLYIPQCVRKYL